MEQIRTRSSFADAVCISIPGDSPKYMEVLKAVFESVGKDVEYKVKCKDGMHYYVIWPKGQGLGGKNSEKPLEPDGGAPPWIRRPKE